MADSNNPKSRKIFSFLLKKECIIAVYFLLAIIAGFKQYQHHSYNNYLIFKYVYYHTIDLQNLYNNYPEYGNSNHYGPIFSLFIAPFASLPDGLLPTDIFPRAIKEFIRLYSFKALPCIIIWLTIIFQILKENFESYLTTDK